MGATPQSQAIQNVNTAISLAAQLLAWYQAATQFANAWNDDGSLAILNALNTCAQGADGSLGTQDGTPNAAHPLNTGVYTGLTRAATPNQITSAITQISNIVSFINGGALSATPGVRSVLNSVTGG